MSSLAPEAERALRSCLASDSVRTDLLTRTAFAPDASLYWYLPQAVVFPLTIAEIQQLFAWSRTYRVPLTFRAAGTSLSGQAVTDGILVEVRRNWQRWQILDGGQRVWSQPGVCAGLINEHLRPYWRRLGPDPASIAICTVGGIVANNASGMCCGTRDTAYRTLDSLVAVLPNGLVLDTALPDADNLLREKAPEIAEGLLRLRQHVLSTPGLCQRIEQKYQLKNTVGYSLNALIDFDSPAAILAHLLVGSEGTLGFIAEVVLRTVPDPPLRLTGFAVFDSPEAACSTVPALRDLGADAVELLDSASLRSINGRPGIPEGLATFPPTAAALLFEYQRFAWSELQECQQETERLFAATPLVRLLVLTTDEQQRAHLWEARRSLYPLVAARRPIGTTPISEDIAVPLEALPETVRHLQKLFTHYGYPDTVIFGHAKDGNLHFVLPQPLQTPADVERYAQLMDDVVALVLQFGGSLKAEHGTGRNMAPFVRAEWGDEAYELMWHIKRLFDPDGLLNPDVILSQREQLHVRNLKQLPRLDSDADRCMECGFCESVCPSRTTTLTPRQRIALLRYLPRPHEPTWWYEVVETCATDGLCQLRCPVGIDTGALVRKLREQSRPALVRSSVQLAAQNFSAVEATTRLALQAGHTAARFMRAHRLQRLTERLNRWSRGALPKWDPSLRSPLPQSRATPPPPDSALFFLSCPARWTGTPELLALPELAQRCGEPLMLFPDNHRFCCGLLFASKGFPEAAAVALERLGNALHRYRARLLVVEGSSCAHWLRSHADRLPIPVVDSAEFSSTLLPRLSPRRRKQAIFLHIPCSARRMGIEPAILQLAQSCAETVLTNPTPECCAAAGDLWLRHPEVARDAGQRILSILEGFPVQPESGHSTNPPCEMLLQALSGFPWSSLTSLLIWAASPVAAQTPVE
ncbi:MAG: FAD-binding and (Fe-S)-binding domain-containing protein [Chlorobiota bacterium]